MSYLAAFWATLGPAAAPPPATSIDYTAAYAAAAGITDAATLAALQTFEQGMKDLGILSNTSRAACLDKALYPIIGTAAQRQVNFIDPAAYPASYAGTMLQGAGWQYNGGGYVQTGVVPSAVLAPADAQLLVYTLSDSQGGETIDLGCQTGARGFWLSARSSDGGRPYARGAGGDLPGNAAVGAGLFALSLRAGTMPGLVEGSIYRNGGLHSTAEGAERALPDHEITAGTLNIDGVPYNYSPRPHTYVAIGRAYTPAQHAGAYTLIQNLQTALGRAV